MKTTWRCARGKPWVRRARAMAVVAAILVSLAFVGDRSTAPPRTQAEAEAHLDRQILAYALWNDVPHVVFEYGGAVHFDRLGIDLVSIEWPPTPRWQWTGMWWTLDAATDPASIALASTGDPVPNDPYRYASDATPGDGEASADQVLFGQVTSPAIVEMQVEIDGVWRSYPVAAPGFAVRLPADSPRPTTARWLNAAGAVIWTFPIEHG